MADEEERFDGDNKRDTLPCLHSTKKRLLCRVREKPDEIYCIKRHLSSSRLFLNAEMKGRQVGYQQLYTFQTSTHLSPFDQY